MMTKDVATALKLEEPQFLIIVPESIFKKLGITVDKINLDLVDDDNRLCLIGPPLY